MEIKNVEIFSNTGKLKEHDVTKIIVHYVDDSSREITEFKDILDELARFAAQCHITDANVLLNDHEKIKVIKNIRMTDVEVEHDEEAEEEDRKKFHLSSRAKKIIAGLAVSALVIGGGLFIHSKNKDEYAKAKSPKTINAYTNMPNPTAIPNGSRYLDNLNAYVEHDDLYDKISNFNNGTDKNRSNLQSILDDISNKAAANVHQLCQFIEGDVMRGDKFLVTFQNAYNQGTCNYVALEKFCSLRNNVIECAFSGNKSNTISALRNFYNEFVDFVYCGTTMNNGSTSFDYYSSEIDGFTRHAILSLGETLLQANVDYSARIAGQEYQRLDIANFTSDAHVGLVEILYNSVRTK